MIGVSCFLFFSFPSTFFFTKAELISRSWPNWFSIFFSCSAFSKAAFNSASLFFRFLSCFFFFWFSRFDFFSVGSSSSSSFSSSDSPTVRFKVAFSSSSSSSLTPSSSSLPAFPLVSPASSSAPEASSSLRFVFFAFFLLSRFSFLI